MNRREFVQSVAAGVATGGLAPCYAGSDDYRALVCVFLLGGNDSFNLIVPDTATTYGVYANRRGFLAVPRNELLPVQAPSQMVPAYGFHPAVPGLHTMYQSGRLAAVANVGTLLEPTSGVDFRNGDVAVPPQLFSHSDQQDQWQTAVPDDLGAVGWAGRLESALASGPLGARPGGELPVNLSLSGSNRLQTGNQARGYSIGTEGPTSLDDVQGPRGAMLNDLFSRPAGSLLGNEYVNTFDRASRFEGVLNAALDSAPALTTAFPASQLGESLGMIARVIAVRSLLLARRQVFFVGVGGWDTHDRQLADHPGLLANVSQCLVAFDDALQELGSDDRVTTLVMSEFGRQLNPNGDGTDHGWGGHALLLGQPVAGGDIYGVMPDLAAGGPDDTGFGSIIPTTPIDRLFADLALWMGVTPGQLDAVFPNLSRFNLSSLEVI